MQPRRLRDWLGVTVFQVTKRGDSVIEDEERWDVRRGWRPMGTNEVEDEAGVVVFVDGERELEDEDAGDEVRESDTRWNVGLRGTGGLEEVSVSEGEESEDDEDSSSSSSSSSRPLGYSAQEDCTWLRVMGVRFSRLAASASKQ